MPTMFEQYAPYRPAVTEQEQEMLDMGQRNQEELLADPTVRYWERGWIDGDGNRAPYPLQQNQMRIALDRASEQFKPWDQRGVIYPEDPGIVSQFPGVDPRGKACEVDMAFAARYARLQAALSSRPPEIQAYVGQQLRNAKSRATDVGRYWDGMQSDCLNIRLNERAAKLALTEETSQWLLEDARSMKEGKANIQRINGFLNVLEYASGLTDRVPTEQERAFLRNIGAPLTPEVEAKRDAPLVTPAEIQVEFENFDHQVQQKFFSDPRSWGRGPQETPQDILNLEAAAGAVSRYSRATADRAISPLFDAAEKASSGQISRGDLITVDGKTIREKMYEDYVAAGKNPADFVGFYHKNVRALTNEYVSAGLMAGKRVEVFVPGRDGSIPREPTQITKTGYQPSPLKKVTLNAWERHFSKYGYFKEKVAKAAEYQRVMAARERVRATNRSAQLFMDHGIHGHVKEQFFRDWMRENGPLPSSDPTGFSVTRSALTTFAVCALAARGHSLEEICDPAQLTAEKQQTGRLVIERLQAGDKQWAGETLFRGETQLLAEIDRLTAGMDFTDPQQILASGSRALFFAASTAFDANQEETHCRQEVYAAAERLHPGQGKEAYGRVTNGVNSVGAFFDFAEKSQTARAALSSGVVFPGEAAQSLGSLISFEAACRLYAEKRSADPTLPMSRCFDLNTMGAFYGYSSMLSGNKVFSSMQNRAMKDYSFQKALGREALSGNLQKRFQIVADMSKMDFRFDVAPASKSAQKEELRARDIEDIARKNAAGDTKKGPVKTGGGRTK